MYLLDTNVICALRFYGTKRFDKNLGAWLETVDMHELYISVVTPFEIQKGILKLFNRDDVEQAKVIQAWADAFYSTLHNDIIDVDFDIAMTCASLHIPRQRPLLDSLIAATCIVYDYTLVTRNIKDFEGIDIKLINPFDLE